MVRLNINCENVQDTFELVYGPATGWCSSPGRSKILLSHRLLDRLLSPPSVLSSGYRGLSLLRIRLSGREPGVYSASNRNEYQKHKNKNISEE
jgi:hypothetical protein